MMEIDGIVTTTHRDPSCVARAIRVDNLSAMKTSATATTVRTTIAATKLRSVIASADDYLMNLQIADEACRCADRQRPENGRNQEIRTGRTRKKQVR